MRSAALLSLCASAVLTAATCESGSIPPSSATGTTAATSLPSATASSTPTPVPAATPTAPPAAAAGVALPNAGLTPGETFPGVTTTDICTPGWASSHRHVTAQQYHDVYASYGIPYPEPSGTYELDHLIALEIGGDNADANLWPEPASPPPGFHQKDALENRLHDLVCAGQLALSDAQHEIATNWYSAYVKYVGG